MSQLPNKLNAEETHLEAGKFLPKNILSDVTLFENSDFRVKQEKKEKNNHY